MRAIIFPQKGSLSRGINIPLIKIRENLIRAESIIIWEGVSVAGDARRTPSEEKQKEDKIIHPPSKTG